MAAGNVTPLRPRPQPRPIELEFENDLLFVTARLTLEEARETLRLISPWEEGKDFRFVYGEIVLVITLSAEGAAVWRDELVLQINHFA